MDIPDRIEKVVHLRAPRARVWKTLTDPDKLGALFSFRFESGPLTPGRRLRGVATHPQFEGLAFEFEIDRVEPERFLSWHWHPFAIERGVDYSHEPPTLVTFTLEDAPDGGTRLVLVESGFSGVPLARRARAFEMNERGWSELLPRIDVHAA